MDPNAMFSQIVESIYRNQLRDMTFAIFIYFFYFYYVKQH